MAGLDGAAHIAEDEAEKAAVAAAAAAATAEEERLMSNIFFALSEPAAVEDSERLTLRLSCLIDLAADLKED